MPGIVLAIAIIALAAPAAAHANAGVGLLVLASPAAIAALLPAIIVEAPILARMLGIAWKRALALSAVANIFSTLVGLVISVASMVIPLFAETSREAVLIALAPMFFISWWIEAGTVRRRMEPERKPLVRRATGIANLVTYVGMAIGVAMLVPPLSETFSRFRLGAPLGELAAARSQVAEHFQLHKAFPAPRSFEVKQENVRSLRLEPGGRLVMVLSYPASPAADGKSIVYEPRIVDSRIVEWRCYSPDMASKNLPASCR
jgi:hypothetical protein